MRAYRVLGPARTGQVNPAGGRELEFAATEADAKAARLRLTGAQSLKRGELGTAVEQVEIPTDKAGLLAFINDLIDELSPAPGQTPGGLADEED